MTRRRPREATMGIGMVKRSIARARLRRAMTVLSSTASEGRAADRPRAEPSRQRFLHPGQHRRAPRGHSASRVGDADASWARARSSEGRDSNLAPIRAPLDAGQRAPCDPTAARVKAPRGSSA